MKEYKYRKWFTYKGKRYSVRANTQMELGLKMQKKLQELETEAHVISGDMMMAAWMDRCIEVYKPGLSDDSKKKYASRMDHCIKEHLGQFSLKSIHPIQVQQCMNLQTGKSHTQVNDVYNALKFFFRMAKANNLIASDPTEHLVKPKMSPKRPRRALTPIEREKINELAKKDRRWYIYLLMLHCGCRTEEAASAMGKDISIVDGTPMLHIRGTKTALSDRFVPIPDELYQIIKDTPKNEYIAINTYGNKITNKKRLWAGFKYYLNIEMGCKVYRNELLPPYPVAPDLVPYCLRHEYCTNLARLGIDIRVAQRLMGHSNISMTANVYTNFSNADIINAAEIINQGGAVGGAVKCQKMSKNVYPKIETGRR